MNAFFQAGNLSFRGSISVDKRVRTFTNSQPMVRNTVRGGPMKINRRTLLSLLGVAPTALSQEGLRYGDRKLRGSRMTI